MEESCCKRSLSWCKKKNSFINLLDEFQFIARDRFGELVEETARGGGGEERKWPNIGEKYTRKTGRFLGRISQIFSKDCVLISICYIHTERCRVSK